METRRKITKARTLKILADVSEATRVETTTNSKRVVLVLPKSVKMKQSRSRRVVPGRTTRTTTVSSRDNKQPRPNPKHPMRGPTKL